MMLTACIGIYLVSLLGLSTGTNVFYNTPNIVCPDCKWICSSDQTCCQMKTGQWGCCMYKNAQCCSDGQHCCPPGTKCNNKAKTCDPVVNTTMVAMKKPGTAISHPNVGLVCPNHSQCPHPGSACCRTYGGTYNCCLYPTNVCCPDGLHCCHSGTVCDQLRLICIPYPSAQQWSELMAAQSAAEQQNYVEV